MNTNGFLTFSTILLIASYLLVYRYDPYYEENMAKFIPENALIYIEQRDGREALEKFRNSQLGLNFEKIDFSTIGREVGIPPKVTEVLGDLQNNYYRLFDDILIDMLVGKRFGVAFFQSESGLNDFSLNSYLKNESLIVSEPRISANILVHLAEKYADKEQVSFQTLQYGDHQITRVKNNQDIIAFSIIEGMIIASFNEQLLRRAINAYDGEAGIIYNKVDFKKGQNLFQKPQRYIYLPIETVHLFIDTLHKYFPENQIALLDNQLDIFQGFSGVTYGAWSRDGFFVDKIVLTYQEEQISEETGSLLKIPAGPNNMLELTTSAPLAYYWSNTIDLNYFLKYLPEKKEKEHAVNRYFKKLEQLSGQKVEELLLDLGSEMSLVVEENKGDNFIPVPLAAAFFRVDSNVDLSAMVNYIVDAFEVPVIEQLYNSVTYLYWVASPQDGLQPLCGYWSNLFFIGNSGQLIERIVDGYNEERSLLHNAQLRRIDPGLKELNNSITYLNNKEILGLAERLFSALATIATLEDREKAEKARIVINKIIKPLFRGLKEYERSCTRSSFHPGMVLIDSRTSYTKEPGY